MYNPDHLRMFVETAETGSFSACGRKLGKAQSAVSQGIANLEIDLGVALFDRSTRKPGLTDAGRKLLLHAQNILLQIEELKSTADAFEQGDETEITLAIDHSLVLPRVLKILEEFKSTHKATALKILTMSSTEIIEFIQNEHADIGLMFADLTFNRKVELGFIGNVSMFTVCSPDHPLAALSSVSAMDLAGHLQIMQQGLNEVLSIDPPEVSAKIWKCNNVDLVKTLTMKGLGWSALPQHMVEPLINTGELIKLPVIFDHKDWTVHVELITAKNKTAGPGFSWLMDRLKDVTDLD